MTKAGKVYLVCGCCVCVARYNFAFKCAPLGWASSFHLCARLMSLDSVVCVRRQYIRTRVPDAPPLQSFSIRLGFVGVFVCVSSSCLSTWNSERSAVAKLHTPLPIRQARHERRLVCAMSQICDICSGRRKLLVSSLGGAKCKPPWSPRRPLY